MSHSIKGRPFKTTAAGILIAASLGWFWSYRATAGQSNQTLSAPFQINILKPPGEAPFDLRFFTTAVKTDSQGKIIDRSTSDPVKNIVGAEAAGERGGLMRFTKIMFGANYFDGTPDTGTRIDPNSPVVTSDNEHWPHADQPFRSWPNALALSPDGKKLYVTLPGREGYPDWRVAVVDTAKRVVLRWVDLRPPGQTSGIRPIQEFGPPQDEGSRQNISTSRNTKHLRAFWDSVPRWLHHGEAQTVREILLPPDSPLLQPGERGFNFRTVRSDSQRTVSKSFLGGPPVVLPTEVPITFADSSGGLAGDGMGPIYVSLDSPSVTQPDGSLQIDRLGTSNLAPLIVSGFMHAI